jgi:hypothetical protein
LSVCVRPGVLLVKASPLRPPLYPSRTLIRLDFPTLLLPKKAISGKPSEGNCSGLAEDVTKVLSITKTCHKAAYEAAAG